MKEQDKVTVRLNDRTKIEVDRTVYRYTKGDVWVVLQTDHGVYRGGCTKGDVYGAQHTAEQQMIAQFNSWMATGRMDPIDPEYDAARRL